MAEIAIAGKSDRRTAAPTGFRVYHRICDPPKPLCGLAREGGRPASASFGSSIKQGISGRFDGLFFGLGKNISYRLLTNNQMNKYDL
ncbi:hypothetical protein [Pseudomonas silesiensis]|uniref:hypothetical protein n=1 Tax=Pseudomonas silesiensis TaxID=1853130 RepID=UPI0030D7545A